MLIPAILVSIVALLAAMDEQLFGASMMARPLFTGPIIGLIMGDLQTGVIIGATLESMFMGSIMVGSAVPPEVYASSILSIAHNKIDEFSGVVCDNDCWIDDEGTYNIHTIHASYQFANVMDMENFNIYLGTYYSILDSDGDKIHGDDSDDRYGARVRFKYFF